ncbi:MAG TPA: PilZ domain-containing protein [Terriglobales bacterium]|nr:PilZ domain-containing protein [Terriglobales bacterium]
MPSHSIKGERRRWRRHWLRAPVRITTDLGVVEGYGLRVSEGGMYLFAVADLAPQSVVEIEFTHPHSGEPRQRAGIVRNRMVYLYGVEFVCDQQQSGSRQPVPPAHIHS